MLLYSVTLPSLYYFVPFLLLPPPLLSFPPLSPSFSPAPCIYCIIFFYVQAKRVQDLFMKQLLQLHGLSVEKVRAILEQYPTLRDLMAAYRAEGSAGEKLLASIRYGFLNRHIGPVISRAIHQFYTNRLL